MKTVKSAWKPPRVPCQQFCSLAWRQPSFGKALIFVSRSILGFSKRESDLHPLDEAGFLLIFLLPLILLLGAFFLGSLEVALQTQTRVALQSRLDVCAVRLAVHREQVFKRLSQMNTSLEITVKGIYTARGLSIVPGVGEAALASEEALLKANIFIAKGQDLLLAKAAAYEAVQLHCAASPFSKELTLCATTPRFLTGLKRRKTLFPDVLGSLEIDSSGQELSQVHCEGPHELSTNIAIQGDPKLRKNWFKDEYL
jgi:hypothetical protein